MISELRKCLAEISDAKPELIGGLKVNDSLIDKGILDSLSTMKFVLALEKQFNVQINFDKINARNFSTLEKIEKFVRGRR